MSESSPFSKQNEPVRIDTGGWFSYGRSEGYRVGLADGYRMAVEESYPEIWTICSRHRPGDFDSKCRLCTGEPIEKEDR